MTWPAATGLVTRTVTPTVSATAVFRDALARARNADEQLRSALAEATVWITLALTGHTEGDDAPG